MHGAISIVNAIATGNGAALGISLKVTADVDITDGSGIKIRTMDENNLIRRIVYNILPKQIISENSVNVSIKSEIPVSFGLKSLVQCQCCCPCMLETYHRRNRR